MMLQQFRDCWKVEKVGLLLAE